MKAGMESGAQAPGVLEKTMAEALSEAVSHAGHHAPSFREAVAEGFRSAFPSQDDGHWPKTVKEFKDGGYLEPGDVVLMTKLGSVFSMLMRLFDRSDFAHCALVFQTPHHEHGIDHTFLIESTMSGVDVEIFTDIVAPKKVHKDIKTPVDYVVGVKRLEAPWSTPSLRRMASSRMLHFINADDYNFRMLAALASQYTSNAYFRLASLLRGQAPTVSQYFQQDAHYMPAQFICSGFVQFAYVDMVKIAIERGMIDKGMAESAWSDVIFSKQIDAATSMKRLMAVKPSELAETPRLKWKYLIHQGMVHKVASNDDVNAFFEKIRVKHRRLNREG
jgi:hypothetical protein